MLSFNQVLTLISAAGTKQTVVVEGQPGIGKTAMGKMLSRKLGMPEVTLDCATMIDGGDITIPWMCGDSFRHVPNAAFCAVEQIPVVICLDEIGKANRSVVAAITPLLRDRKVAGVRLHPDTIIYATSNNSSDGVGDNIPAHIWNGVTLVQMRNPTADEWVDDFALPYGVCGEVIVWARQNPNAFQHYTDGSNKKPENNLFIFNPYDPSRRQYVSPRSLERVSRIIEQRHLLDATTLLQAVSGTIGAPAAHELITLAALSDKLPAYADVIANPTTTKVPPRGTGATQVILALNLCVRASQEGAKRADREAVATYIARLSEEVQSLFVHQVSTSPHVGLWAVANAAYGALAVKVGNMS
jgi:hypothetical protein